MTEAPTRENFLESCRSVIGHVNMVPITNWDGTGIRGRKIFLDALRVQLTSGLPPQQMRMEDMMPMPGMMMGEMGDMDPAGWEFGCKQVLLQARIE